jgi:hypothetical protein
MRKAGFVKLGAPSTADGTPQVVTTDKISALKELIGIAQAEKVCVYRIVCFAR